MTTSTETSPRSDDAAQLETHHEQLIKEQEAKKLAIVRKFKPRVFASFVTSCTSLAIFIPTVIAAITLLAENPSLFSNGVANLEIAVIAVGAVAIAALISGITSAIICKKQHTPYKKAIEPESGISIKYRLFEKNLHGSPFKPQEKLTEIEYLRGLQSRQRHRDSGRNYHLLTAGSVATSPSAYSQSSDGASEDFRSRTPSTGSMSSMGSMSSTDSMS